MTKRKKLNIFSLSFLDIITCGLGAIILLFVLINAKSSAQRDTITTDLRAEVDRIEKQVLEGKKKLIVARNSLDEIVVKLVKTESRSRESSGSRSSHVANSSSPWGVRR